METVQALYTDRLNLYLCKHELESYQSQFDNAVDDTIEDPEIIQAMGEMVDKMTNQIGKAYEKLMYLNQRYFDIPEEEQNDIKEFPVAPEKTKNVTTTLAASKRYEKSQISVLNIILVVLIVIVFMALVITCSYLRKYTQNNGAYKAFKDDSNQATDHLNLEPIQVYSNDFFQQVDHQQSSASTIRAPPTDSKTNPGVVML